MRVLMHVYAHLCLRSTHTILFFQQGVYFVFTFYNYSCEQAYTCIDMEEVNIQAYASMYVYSSCEQAYKYIDVHIYTCKMVRMCVCRSTRNRRNVHVHIHTYTRVYIHTYIHVYTYT